MDFAVLWPIEICGCQVKVHEYINYKQTKHVSNYLGIILFRNKK